MGAKKSSKNFQKTSKICEFPSLEPQNRVERCPKPSQTKTNQENPEPEEGSRTIQEEPLLTEGLSVHIGNIYREQKRRGTPPLNTSAEKHPSHLYVSRRLNQLCTRSALQRPGSSCHGEPSQNDRAAGHPWRWWRPHPEPSRRSPKRRPPSECDEPQS